LRLSSGSPGPGRRYISEALPHTFGVSWLHQPVTESNEQSRVCSQQSWIPNPLAKYVSLDLDLAWQNSDASPALMGSITFLRPAWSFSAI
jgi:hypothetical protein